MKKLLPLIFFAALLLPGPVSAQSPEEGAALYQQKCTGCHTIGGGNLAGPDLQGVTALRERDWLVRWLMEPDVMLAEGDPTASQLLDEFNNVPMPNLGLSQTEAEAILAFLENPDAAGASGAAAPAVKALPPGDANRGQALFLGQQALANGGTACIACHSTGSHGALGGGTLGPDLTHAAYRYGTPGFQVALQGLPFPTMQGVFNNRPLTDQEVADLHAFLLQEDLNAAPQPTGYGFVLIGLVGSVGLLAVGHVTWRKRQNGGIRQTLVDRANRP